MRGMLRVGLTGGIGAGKSTVAGRLAEHGAALIDADAIAREVVAPGTDGLAEVVRRFGDGVLTADGELDRQALADRAFAGAEARRDLNAIMHPRIGARTDELMRRAADDAIVVHDIPLLVEGNLAAAYHIVLVVDADEQTRVHRLGQSRGIDEADARARIAAQASTEQRERAADVWLDNSGPEDVVLNQVDSVWADRLVPFEANIRLRKLRTPNSPRIVPPDPDWPVQAARLIGRIGAAVGDSAVRVDHIGSTAVPDLPAKDVIDLQLVVPSLDEADAVAASLDDAGFVRREDIRKDDPQDDHPDPDRWAKRIHLGVDPARPVNLHVRPVAGPAWRLALLFRDWLRDNPGECVAYAEAKRALAEQHAADGESESYADAKQPWIDAALQRAEDWAARTGWTPSQS